MRGFASVLTVAFVFASASLLIGQVAGQSSTEPSPPQEYRQPAPDAFVQGTVTGPKGPIEGASVSISSSGPSGGPQPMPAEDSGSGSSGSSGDASIACYGCYYGGYNSTMTDANGHFSMGAWSGENQLSVYHNDFVGHSEAFKLSAGERATHDVVMQAYPDKTAHLVGKVTDAKTGKGLSFASVSVRSPQYGPGECSQAEGSSSGSGGGGTADPASGGESKSMAYPYPGYSQCAITMHSDGSFEGDVTPGYTILSVYAYQDCSTRSDADGSGSTTCGPEYLQFSRTLVLPDNATTRVDVALQSRAAPDATVSGYLVDSETGQAIPGAQVSFNSQETYAGGYATTDSDGSFKIRLRSGYHSVYAYAPGHFSWEGVLQVKAGSSDFDVKLTPGQEQYGGYCCYYAMEGKSGMMTADAAAPPMAAGGSGSGGASGVAANDASSDQQTTGDSYEDLGGGLGPYDASERSQATANSDGELGPSDGKGAPGPGVLLAFAALGAVLVIRRRKA
ncbi:MAG: CarboxypepD reg-like domain [Thermoplasmata archaeon]|nr:CarboxypepD reg-like domain [Thermoplasmata archaeon]